MRSQRDFLQSFSHTHNQTQTLITLKHLPNSMKEAIRKEIIFDLNQIHTLLEKTSNPEEIQKLSNHTIADVAAYKDIDIITMSVLIYALYKIYHIIKQEERDDLSERIIQAKTALGKRNLTEYNHQIKNIYTFIQSKGATIKEHLESVMQAARIKKGTVLLEHGLTMGQAAGLMGLSNWDLQEYASKTIALEPSKETIHTTKRLKIAYQLFNLE